MSRLKVQTVNSSRKVHKCGKCGVTINVGESYVKAVRFRQSDKIRCNKPACYFSEDELESNSVLAALIRASGHVADARSEIEEARDELQDQYDAIGDTNLQYTDRYAMIESAISDLEDYLDALGDGPEIDI
jgi:hypothetical protein